MEGIASDGEADPDHREEDRHLWLEESRRQDAGTDRRRDRERVPPRSRVPGRRGDLALGGRVGARPGNRSHRPRGHAAGDRDERQEAEEDDPPVPRLGHEAGDRRAHQARDDPGGRHRREHPGSETGRQASADCHIGDRWHGPAADALDEAADHDHRHRLGQPAGEQADRKQRQAQDEREEHAALVDEPADDRDSNQRAEEERREDPAVQLEAA